MNIGDKFRLIGNTTVFRAVAIYEVAGFIPTVHGVTLDGKRQTRPRVVDTIILEEADDSQGSLPL